MKEEEIVEKVKEMITEQFGVEKENIKENSTFTEDLDADSLDVVELVMNIEEYFNIKIPDEEAEKLITVGDVAKYIMDHQ